MQLSEQIQGFQPYTEQEAEAKEKLLFLIQQYGNKILDRDCEAGHITCSGMILSPDLQKTLMAYHLLYQSVGWTGGHADGNADVLAVAMQEAREETSVTQIYPVSGRILSIDILPVSAHKKNGKSVAGHLHYNISYGLIAPEQQTIADKPDENKNVGWLAVEEIAKHCTEAHMLPIYEKLIRRIKSLVQEKQTILPQIPALLQSWYPEHHRDLPWRADRNPYHVWISEIMLQQTRVEAVRNDYIRFLNALPDIQALADCNEETLLKLWEGLGYYNRAKNMQKAAQQIMQQHNGKFPVHYADIRNLAGIGEYTAGAICSICYQMPTPAVDGNVLRVMARLLEDFRNVLNQKVKAAITKQLEKIYPGADCYTLTQALIELGATVCIPNHMPKCEICPLQHICLSHRHKSQMLLPVREKKQKRRTEQKTVYVLTCENKIAIRKRPAKGLLASLWELPNTENFQSPEDAVQQCMAWGVKPVEFLKTVQRKHVFTHITWEMQGVFLTCRQPSENFIWAAFEELESVYALPTAFRCILL